MSDSRPTSYPRVTLRPYGADDLEFLYLLFLSARADLVALAQWDEERREKLMRMQFDAQHAQYQRQFPAGRHDIIIKDGINVGRLYVDGMPDEIRVVDITLLPEHRHQGIGRALLQDLLAEGARSGRPVSLHVEARNPARRLYTSLGFTDTEEDGVYRRMDWVPPDPAAHTGEP